MRAGSPATAPQSDGVDCLFSDSVDTAAIFSHAVAPAVKRVAADGEQVRPPLHSPETFLHLRESHSKYYRYY